MIIVFLVAGMSSRFNGKIKQLAKVGPNDETLIEFSVNQALKSNFDKIVFITNSNTEHLFKEIFSHVYNDTPVEYYCQSYDSNKRSRPWGTTDALCVLCGKVNEPFIMVNGDDIYGELTFRKGKYLLHGNNIIGGCKMINTLPKDPCVTANRGVIEVSSEKVISIKEMLNISQSNNHELMNKLANVNFIGLQPCVLDELKVLLDEFKRQHEHDEKIEALLPNDLNTLIANKTITMKSFEIKNKIKGITHPEDEAILREELKLSGFM